MMYFVLSGNLLRMGVVWRWGASCCSENSSENVNVLISEQYSWQTTTSLTACVHFQHV